MGRSPIKSPRPVPRLIPSVVNADPAVLARESTSHADAILRGAAQTAAAQTAAAAAQVVANSALSTATVVSVKQFGAAGDGVTDDTVAIQAALDAADGGAGVVYVPSGNHMISDTLYVPTFVVIMGTGRNSTGTITASSTFPTDGRPMIRLGRVTDSIVFGCRVENLYIDAASRAGTIIYSLNANEQSGIKSVLAFGFTQYGFRFDNSSGVHIEDVEVYPQASGATTGIYLNQLALDNVISSATVGVSGPLVNGIHIFAAQCTCAAIHVENCTTGIRLDTNSSGLLVGVNAAGGPPNVGDVILTTGGAHHIGLGLVKNNATRLITDSFAGFVNSDPFVMLWINGETIIGGSLHYPFEDTATQITSNQDNYTPGSQFTFGQVIRISSDAARDITGIAAANPGRMIWLYNSGAFNITLKHQNAGSGPVNRIVGRGNADTVLTPGLGAQLYYSPSQARWHVLT